jgi:hypothetical protein
MVTIAFLLITAVWVSFSRINANAQVPGPPDSRTPVEPGKVEKVLHVHVAENDFSLVWRQAALVLSETRVPKVNPGGEVLRYAELEQRVAEQWREHSGHQDPSDREVDLAVLHTDNRLPFRDVVAVMDAIYATQRPTRHGSEVGMKPAFNLTFSAH